jgi:hypothetical protein
MMTKALIMAALVISCVLPATAVWAETKGYIDSNQNPTTQFGVLGARYTAPSDNGAAVTGWCENTTGSHFGGWFGSASSTGMGVFGSGGKYCGYFQSDSTAIYGKGDSYGGEFHALNGTAVSGYGHWLGGYFYAWSPCSRGHSD